MTENKKLRALLAEAREWVTKSTHIAIHRPNIGWSDRERLRSRIDDALAEPAGNDFKRGAEAMREAAAVRLDTEGINGSTGPYFGNIIRALPVPEDE